MKTASDPENRCTFLFADGRRCRMLQTRTESTLCPHHAKEELQRREAEKLKAELAGLSGAVSSATQVCEVLGKVFNALAEGRITARTANTLGYLGQLMLQSMPAVRREVNDAVGHSRAYDALLRHQLPIVRKFRKLE
jgi:hypothetical protein